ncbi:MAG: hypothetical protein HYW34_02995 [Candidatus Brennerbacteria bacterium]|nr:hypothetical protein [Candidatus Brennerbacteria bacterium]
MKKSHAAGWNSDSPTPAQLKEFFSQVKSRRITKRNLQGFLRNSSILNENTARAIFGDDIIFPDEIAEARHLSYTKDQLRHFTETIPAEETLRALKAQNFALIAGPPSPMSLFDVRQIKSELFSKKICGYEWCEDYKIIKKFTSKDKVGT